MNQPMITQLDDEKILSTVKRALAGKKFLYKREPAYITGVEIGTDSEKLVLTITEALTLEPLITDEEAKIAALEKEIRRLREKLYPPRKNRSYVKVEDVKEEVLEYHKHNPQWTYKQIAEKVNCSPSTVRRIIKGER